jgi:hypothetical protein
LETKGAGVTVDKNKDLDWDEKILVERFMKSCPNCSKTLSYNQFVYDLGYRKCLWCASAIETYLPDAVNYLLIAVALSGLLTSNPVWDAIGLACGVVWAFRRFRLRQPLP